MPGAVRGAGVRSQSFGCGEVRGACGRGRSSGRTRPRACG